MIVKPTETEREYLDVIQEECAEIIQIAAKIKRFGFESYHPDDPERTTNRTLMEKECADLLTLLGLATTTGMLRPQTIYKGIPEKMEKLKKFGVLK